MENSKIEWTDHTFNPWIGCQHVSPGCDHCYAEAKMDHQYRKVQWGPHGERKRTSEEHIGKIRGNGMQTLERLNESTDIDHALCASLADVFDNQVQPEWRRDLFALKRRAE